MKNLSRISNHANRIQSVKDWGYVAQKAITAGRRDIVYANTPEPEWGWRKVDQCTAAIRAEFGWPPVYKMREQEAKQA